MEARAGSPAFRYMLGHRDRARAAAARQGACGGARNVTLLKTVLCVHCCILKEHQTSVIHNVAICQNRYLRIPTVLFATITPKIPTYSAKIPY